MSELNAMVTSDEEREELYLKKDSLKRDLWILKNYFGYEHSWTTQNVNNTGVAQKHYEAIPDDLDYTYTGYPHVANNGTEYKTEQYLEHEFDGYEKRIKKINGTVEAKIYVEKNGYTGTSDWHDGSVPEYDYVSPYQHVNNALGHAVFQLVTTTTTTDYEPWVDREFNEELLI